VDRPAPGLGLPRGAEEARAWYRDANGKNFTLWPTHTFTFKKQLSRFDAESYTLRRPAKEIS
jgi:hypothetical protein